jgi:hypothetical protein
MPQDNDLVLLIGRIEGKVDTLVHLQGATAQRLDSVEQRTASVEQKVAAITASGSNSKTWLTQLASFSALAVAAVGAYFGFKE